MKDEDFHIWAQRHDLTGCGLEEIGVLLRFGLLRSTFRLGEAARVFSNTIVGNVCDTLDKDVLPLPCGPPGSAEESIFKAITGGASPADIRRNMQRTLRSAGRAAWLSLLIVLVNYMSLGLGAVPVAAPGSSAESGFCRTNMSCCSNIRLCIVFYV